MTTSIVGVVILLGGLIFFHELGHFSVAKFFGVKVEIFSLGFGYKLISKIWGETEYRLSLFPFGGYVKLMGDDPYQAVPAAEADRAFSTQKLYKRFLIVAAGPIANLVMALILFLIIFWNGKPVDSHRVGHVDFGSPAWEVGLRAGDRVLEVNGKPVQTWRELEDELKGYAIGTPAELKIDRFGTDLRLPVTLSKVRRRNPYGEVEEVGGLRGIRAAPLAAVVGVTDASSLAFRAGLQTGDVVTKVDNKTVTSFRELEDIFSEMLQKKPDRLTVTLKRKTSLTSEEERSFSLAVAGIMKPAADTAFPVTESFGIRTSELFVKQVAPGSPAEKAAIQYGDRLLKVNSKPILNFESLIDEIHEVGAKNEALNLTVERLGKPISVEIKPLASASEDPLTRQPVTKYMIGVEPLATYREAESTKIIVRNPIALVERAVSETYITAERMLVSIGKLITGKISAKNLGGPVLIASIAGKSLAAGVIQFLQTMALISINLFLLNLLPIPVLDGGHLFFFTLEALKGKPVSIRTMEIANQVGMVFILMLVGLTLFNDISWITKH